jgi:hypothetical protein
MNERDGATKTAAAQPPTRHLVIAGTGRAGTSFLVRYLTELGLDTTLSRRGKAAGWDDAANAGLEELLVGGGEHLPYVVKSPWIGEHIEQVLADPSIKVDAILVPVRDLVEAATSRAVLEMRAIHQRAPWMAQLDRSWEVWAGTAGGVVYSLNPLDQARLLAVGFHNLVWRAVEAEVPVHFLAFPRLVEDKEYLFRVLRPILPPETTAKQAHDAHMRTVDLSKVRVGSEMSAMLRREKPTPAHRAAELLRTEEVEMLALRRELVRLRAELEVSAADAERSARETADLRGEMQRAIGELERTTEEAIALRAALAAESARSEQLSAELAAIPDSWTWRMTAPIRTLLTAVKGKVRS